MQSLLEVVQGMADPARLEAIEGAEKALADQMSSARKKLEDANEQFRSISDRLSLIARLKEALIAEQELSRSIANVLKMEASADLPTE